MKNIDKVFKPLGASNHCEEEREENDFYATDPNAIDDLLKYETFDKNIWKCAVGQGHLAQRLKQHGYTVKCTDLIDRGYPNTEILDFLKGKHNFDGDIITNPPYKYCTEFILNTLNSVKDGHKVAMFLKIQALEGKNTKNYIVNTHQKIYMFTLKELVVLKMVSLINIVNVLFAMHGLCGKKGSKATLLLNGFKEKVYKYKKRIYNKQKINKKRNVFFHW